MAKTQYYDPEPFTVVAGIVSGFAGVISLYRSFAPVSFKTSHRKAITILEGAVFNLESVTTSRY